MDGWDESGLDGMVYNHITIIFHNKCIKVRLSILPSKGQSIFNKVVT